MLSEFNFMRRLTICIQLSATKINECFYGYAVYRSHQLNKYYFRGISKNTQFSEKITKELLSLAKVHVEDTRHRVQVHPIKKMIEELFLFKIFN